MWKKRIMTLYLLVLVAFHLFSLSVDASADSPSAKVSSEQFPTTESNATIVDSEYERKNLFWNAFGAVGGTVGACATAGAVVVALWQTKYSQIILH